MAHCPHGVDRAEQVGLDDGFRALRIGSVGPALVGDARIRDEHVDPAEPLEGELGDGRDLGVLPDVCDGDLGCAAGRLHGGHDLRSPPAVAVGEDDPCAEPSKGDGDCRADPARDRRSRRRREGSVWPLGLVVRTGRRYCLAADPPFVKEARWMPTRTSR